MNSLARRWRWKRRWICLARCLLISGSLYLLYKILPFKILGYIDTSNLDTRFCKQGCDTMGFDVFTSGSVKIGRYFNISKPQSCPLHYGVRKSTEASVVLVFHLSIPSMLLRALFSILHRSPDSQLLEVIVITDAPGRDFILNDLQYYVAGWPMSERVRVVATRELVGAQRLQQIGIMQARAPIVVVLDSLVEVTEGWLSPLLITLQKDSSTIALPATEDLHPDTYTLIQDPESCTYIYSFDWFMKTSKECSLSADTAWSHTMTSHVFAMHKHRFWDLGGYDPGCPAKTEATLELPFKSWMCGGSVQVVPCSRIARVAMTSRVQSAITSRSLAGNLRVAAVWMDEYAQYVFDRMGVKHASYGNIDNQIWLRKRLGCNRFKWYVDTVATSVKPPDKMIRKGQVINIGTNLCLSFPTEFVAEGEVRTRQCHGSGQDQFWMWSHSKKLRHDVGCLQVLSNTDSVFMSKCEDMAPNQMWIYNQKKLLSESRQKCLAVASNNRTQLQQCTTSKSQQWIFIS